MERTSAWAARARVTHRRDDQALFGIVQGGVDEVLRAESAERTVALDFDGYGIGGLSVGETRAEMVPALAAAIAHLPADRPRDLAQRQPSDAGGAPKAELDVQPLRSVAGSVLDDAITALEPDPAFELGKCHLTVLDPNDAATRRFTAVVLERDVTRARLAHDLVVELNGWPSVVIEQELHEGVGRAALVLDPLDLSVGRPDRAVVATVHHT